MTAEQLDLDWRSRPCPAEEAHPRAAELMAALRGRGWLSRRDLEGLGFGERELREIVERDEAAAIFSYPGSPGYKLFDEVTEAEFRAGDALKSQGDRMRRRWLRYQRRHHRRNVPLND